MKRSNLYAILTLCAALLAALPQISAANTDPAEATGQPRAVVDEPIFEAGKVDKGGDINHDFVIRNTGDTVLRIEEVRPACGCTVANYDESIAPGASGKIHAVLDTTDQTGPISKGLTVITNDPDNPRLTLTIKAEVSQRLFVRPGFARFVQTKGSGVGQIDQIIFTRDFDDLEVLEVKSPYPFITAEAREATEEELLEEASGKQWVVTVKLDYDQAPVGSLADYVRIHTNHPKQEVVSVPVTGFVRPMYVLTPAEADFGEIEVEEDGTWAAMILKNYGPNNMSPTLDNADSLPEGIDVEVSEVEEGREYRVEITLREDLPKGEFSDVIRLKTGLEDKSTIEIPLTGNRI